MDKLFLYDSKIVLVDISVRFTAGRVWLVRQMGLQSNQAEDGQTESSRIK